MLDFFWGIVDGGEDGDGEDEEDEAESPWDGEVDVARNEHFDADKGEDYGEADVEVGEEFDEAGDGEVEGAEAENGEGVGGEDDKGVSGDGEDGGNGVDGEDEVGGSEGEEDKEEGGTHPAVALADEEVAVVEMGGDGDEFAGEADEGILVGLNFGIAAFEEFDPCVDEEGTEDVDEPLESVDEGDAGKDKEGAKKEGSDDAPEEGGELGFFGDGEIGEENGKDKDVIDAEGEFDDIAGKEFHGGLGAEGEGNDHTES